MKKIININLAGRVIPIEDSAYESLQRYIESLRRYFANEEGRDEIINDIESRIAELMNDKVRRGAAAVTDEDIQEIINSMGRVEDFEKEEKESANTSEQTSGTYTQQEYKRPKGRLYRDSSDKLLGGVASGLANYLDVDPAVIRILLILFGFTGTGILLYIILWIVLPAKNLDNYRGKRLFRNPDDKVIAGVAGGVGAYFNIHAWVVRLILLSPLLLNIIFGTFNGIFFSWHRDIFPNVIVAPFTGTFILAYIILWMVLPEARSPFEKMEMRGETVDVNRIKQNVQEGMGDFKNRMQAWGEEVKSTAERMSSRAKEFSRTQGADFASDFKQTSQSAARGVGHIIGVIIKAFFIFIAGCIVLALFGFLIALVFGGVASGPINQFLWTSNLQKLSAWGTLLFFITVPVVAFMTWLIRRVVNAKKGAHLGWIFGGLWTLGWICAITFAASIAKDLRVYGKTNGNEVAITQPAKGRMIVKVNEPEVHYSGTFWWMDDENNGWDVSDDYMKYTNVKLRTTKSDDSLYHVTVYKYSAGSSAVDAQSRAAKTVFNISSQDSILNLGSGLTITRESKFRGQGVVVEIEIPVGKSIRFDESVIHAYNPWVVRRSNKESRYWGRHWNSDWDFDDYFNLDANTDYVMSADGKLLDPNEKKEEEKSPTQTGKKINKDSLQRVMEERKRLNERDQQLLEQGEDAPDSNSTGFQIKNQKHSNDGNAMTYTSSFAPLII